MNKIIGYIAASVTSLLLLTASAQDSLTPRARIDLIPLPQGVSVERDADISKDPIIAFSEQHSDFASIDPFMMERRAGIIPEHVAIKFTTSSQPRDVFLFFKRFFNTEAEKTESERTLFFYSSRSYFSFDPKNEADVTRDKGIGAAAFYRIEACGAHERRVDIVVFSDGKSDKTTVYVIALDGKA